MSRQATAIARRVHEALETATGSRLDLEKAIRWPGESEPLWPRADISGLLSTGEFLIVEIDHHADPVRSVVKYWPLLHAMDSGEPQHPPIAFVEVSQPDDTFGTGYQLLAKFIGERFTDDYSGKFRFRYIDLGNGDEDRIAEAIVAFLSEAGGHQI